MVNKKKISAQASLAPLLFKKITVLVKLEMQLSCSWLIVSF